MWKKVGLFAMAILVVMAVHKEIVSKSNMDMAYRSSGTADHQSSRYLSIEYIFDYITAENTYWCFCVAVDIQNGEVIFLDDLIDINDEFATFVKNGRTLRPAKAGFDMTFEETIKVLNDFVSKQNPDYIKRVFDDFTSEN